MHAFEALTVPGLYRNSQLRLDAQSYTPYFIANIAEFLVIFKHCCLYWMHNQPMD